MKIMSKSAQLSLSIGKTFLIMYLIWLGAFILINFINSIYLPEYFRPCWEMFAWSLLAATVTSFLGINKGLFWKQDDRRIN